MARSSNSDYKKYVEITSIYKKCSIIACLLFALSSKSNASLVNANGTSNSYESKGISYNQTYKYDDAMISKKSNQYNTPHHFNKSINWLQLNDSKNEYISNILPISNNNYSRLEPSNNDNVNCTNQYIGFESDIKMQILPMPSTKRKYSESDDYEFTHRKKRPQPLDNLSAQDINSEKHIKTDESGLYNNSGHRSTIIENSKNKENKIHKNETGSIYVIKEFKKQHHSRDVDKNGITKSTASNNKESSPKFDPEGLIHLKTFIDKQIFDIFAHKNPQLILDYQKYSDSDLSYTPKLWIHDYHLNPKTTSQTEMNLLSENNDRSRTNDSTDILQENDDDFRIPEGLLRELENRERPYEDLDRDKMQDKMDDHGQRRSQPRNHYREGSAKRAPDDGTRHCTDVCEAKTLVVVFVGTAIGLIVVVTLSFYWWKFSHSSQQEVCIECVSQCNS